VSAGTQVSAEKDCWQVPLDWGGTAGNIDDALLAKAQRVSGIKEGYVCVKR
jgi:Arc/MetJ family transcription regulator